MVVLIRLLTMMETIASADSMLAAMGQSTKLGKSLKRMQKAGGMDSLQQMSRYFIQNKTKIGRAIVKLSKLEEETLIKRFGERAVKNMKQSVKGFEEQYKAVKSQTEKTRQHLKDIQERNTRFKDQKDQYPPKRVVSGWIEWVAYNEDLGQMRMKTKSSATVYIFPFFPKAIAIQMRETTTGAGTILWKEYWHKLGSRNVAKKGVNTKQAANMIANNPHLTKLLKQRDPLAKLTKQINKQFKGTGVKIPRPTRTKTGGIKWK